METEMEGERGERERERERERPYHSVSHPTQDERGLSAPSLSKHTSRLSAHCNNNTAHTHTHTHTHTHIHTHTP